MRIAMEWLAKVIEQLKTAKWWFIVIVMLSGILFVYSPSIAKIAEYTFITNKANTVNEDLNTSKIINSALEGLRYKAGADIAFIVLFHNGVVYSEGSHKNKMSRDFEVCAPGIMPRALNYQDLPVSLFITTLEDIMDNKYHYDDINRVEDALTRELYKQYGVTATSIAPYFNEDGKLQALIGVEYISRKPDTEMILWRNKLMVWDSKRMWDIFFREANEIGELL